MSEIGRARCPSKEARRKNGDAHRGQPKSEEQKRKTSQTLTGHKVSEETRMKISGAGQGRICSENARKNHRSATLKLWQDPEYAQKVSLAQRRRPNKLESAVGEILVAYGFAYVGDGSYMVACKSPDFWDGGQRLIEVFGDYWHRGENPQDRITFFNNQGYECLVIWESEFKSNKDNMITKITAFAWGL